MMRLFVLFVVIAGLAQAAAAQGTTNSLRNSATNRYAPSNPAEPGIHEVIPKKFEKRYQEWKTEFLSTDSGGARWQMYASHPRLALTITISGNNSKGAGSGKYKWSENGDLIAATITLGSDIDRGFPS